VALLLLKDKIMKTLRITALGALVALALTCGASAVPSTTFDSTLNIGNDTAGGNTVGGFAGPFGTVNVSLSGQVATITFTGLNGFQFGDGSSVGVNVNSTSFTEAIISDSDFKAFDLSNGNVDGLGDFNLVVNNNNFSMGFNTISFSVTNTGTAWGSAADVLAFNSQTMNGGPFDAEAHVRQSVGNPQGLTGFAGESGGGTTVPDGGTTVMLLGSALGVLGLIRRFVKA
jgi:VPDSG-CTERM motif